MTESVRFGKSRRLKILSLLALSLLFFDAVVYATGYTQDLTETLTGAINAVNHLVSPSDSLTGAIDAVNHLTSPSDTLTGCFNVTKGGGCLSAIAVCTSGCAVQPVTSSMANGATAATLTLSGSGLNMSSIPSNGKTYHVLMDNNTALTLTEPTDGSTSRYRFTSMVTTETGSACHVATSGTDCTLWTAPTNYLQYSDTFKAQYTGTAPATGAPEHCAQAGAAATIGDLTTAGISGWCDYGSIAYAQDAAPGGTSTNQVSSTPLTYGKVLDMPFGGYGSGGTCPSTLYSLTHNNLTATSEASPTCSASYASLTSSNTQYFTLGNVLGTTTAFTYACEFSTSTTGQTGYILSKYDTPANGGYGMFLTSSNEIEAVYATGSTAYTIISSGTSFANGATHILLFSWSGSDLYLYADGSQAATPVASSAAPSAGTDPLNIGVSGGTGFPFKGNIYWCAEWNYSPSNLGAFASELNSISYPSGLVNEITSSSNTYTVNYYQQTPDSVSYSVSGGGTPTAPTFTGVSLGQTLNHVVTLTTSAQTLWLDAGSSWSVPHVESGTSTQRWATNPDTGTASSTIAPVYYNQFDQPTKIDYVDGGTTSVSLTCTDYGANNATALTTSSQNFWADSGGTCSVPATTSIVSGASRLSMGPTYSYSVSKSGSVPSVLDGYLQYFLDDASGIGVSGQNNGTAYSPTGSAWFDHGTVTAAGLSTNSYALDAASWLYQVSPAGYQVLSNSSLSPVPSLSADTLSWTASGPMKWSLYDPSSSGYVVQTVNDNGVATSFSGPTSSGSGNVYTASGSSPWTIDLAATGTSQSNNIQQGGGGYVPPSCPVGEFLNSTSGACQTPAAPTQIGNTAIPNTTVEEGVAVLLIVVIVALVASKEEKKTSDFVRREEKKVRFPRPKKR